MNLQLTSSVERFAANVTEKRFVSLRVNFLVQFQFCRSSKTLPTNLTAEMFYPHVQQLVWGQRLEVGDRFAANVAAVGLLSGVAAAVDPQLLFESEGVITDATFVRFLVHMLPQVISQTSPACVCFIAHFTFVRSLSGV